MKGEFESRVALVDFFVPSHPRIGTCRHGFDDFLRGACVDGAVRSLRANGEKRDEAETEEEEEEGEMEGEWDSYWK